MQKPALYSALLAACVLILSVEASAKTIGHRPVVVELFTSQGCSACLAADALAADLAERKDVLALTFPVDYWDYLGWQDTFARPEFSARQRAYQKALGLRDVYTPQLVIDGAAQMGKAAPETAADMIRDAARAHGPAPAMAIRKGRLTIGAGRFPAGGADVWLVRYEGQPQETAVKDGENRGVTVVYRNVAKSLTRLGSWSGRMRSYALPPSHGDSDLRSAVLLQSRASGRILGVLRR